MKRLLPLIAALGMSLSLGMAHAEDKPKTAQQEKMTACNKDATGKKGDERKAFMKTCLSAKADMPAAAEAVQVHANTFRYRMRRVRELFDLDLEDPDVRLMVWLQLRTLA